MQTNTTISLKACAFLVLFIGFRFLTFAQCPTGPITLTTQAGVNAFCQANSACDTLKVNLTITGADISDLSPFDFLKRINGQLIIKQTALQTLHGLHHIDSVAVLEINNNNNLTRLTGLESLRSIGGDMKILSNASLENFVGLTSLGGIKGKLEVSQNPALIDCAGLEGVFGLGALEIYQNTSILNLNGLTNCQNIGSVKLHNNAQLTSLSGMLHLENIWGGLQVKHNNALLTLGDFPALRLIKGNGIIVDSNLMILDLGNFPVLDTIQNQVIVRKNDALTSLGNMPKMKVITADLTIERNNSLHTVSGWPNLKRAYNITISTNNELVNIVGFEGMDTVGGINVYSNAKLKSINAFRKLKSQTSIFGIWISSNPMLDTISGFTSLKNSISIGIFSHDSLVYISGFDSLLYNARDFRISSNKNLRTINGFQQIKSSGHFQIIDNQQLTRIEGFQFLESITQTPGGYNYYTGDLRITNNPALEYMPDFQALKSVYSDLIISNCNLSSSNLNFLNLAAARKLDIKNNSELKLISGSGALPVPVEISNNTNLQTILQLSAGGNLIINNNPELADIDAFHFSNSISNIVISNNAKLATFNGFTNVTNANVVEFSSLPLLQQLPPIKDTSLTTIIIKNCNSLLNLDGFGTLQSIRYLTIDSCMALQNLSGLAQLREVTTLYSNTPWGGPTYFHLKNSGMINLAGLSSLEKVNEFVISGNTNLASIGGLPKLKQILGSLRVQDNPELTQVRLNDSLKILEGSLYLINNSKLTQPEMLKNLRQVWGIMHIETMPFTNLDFMDSIDFFAELAIIKNDWLTSLSGLHKLTGTKSLHLEDNPKLTDISALELLRVNEKIILKNNQLLNECAIFPVCERIASKKADVTILNNGNQCSQIDTVFAQCSNTQIMGCGKVFLDKVCNGVFDTLHDQVLTTGTIIDAGSHVLLSTLLTDGSYCAITPISATVSFRPMLDTSKYFSVPAVHTIQSGMIGAPSTGLDFAVCLNTHLNETSGKVFLDKSCNGVFDTAFDQLIANRSIRNVLNNQSLTLTTTNGTYSFISSNAQSISFRPQIDTFYFRTTPTVYTLPGATTTGAFRPDIDFGVCTNAHSETSGKVFLDKACNGTFQASEDVYIQNQLIVDYTTGLPLSITGTDGGYKLLSLPPYAVSYKPRLDQQFYKSVPIFRTTPTSTSPSISTGKDFSVCPDSIFHDLEVIATTSGAPPRPGFAFAINVCIVNKGPWPEENVVLTFDLDDVNFPFITIVDSAGAQVNQDVFTWNIGQLDPFESKCFTIQLKLSPAIALGQQLLAVVSSNYSNYSLDVTQSNNHIRWLGTVVGSYDPNVKLVDRKTIPYQGHQDESILDYTIYFQNTGTAPAIFVEVHDTISSKLDLRTFEMVDASHAYTVTFIDDKVIKWRFDNINLPDSASNPLGSIGFARFRIAAHEGLPLYEQVKNAVAIYFDYNQPIFTDTAIAVVCPKMQLQTLAYDAKCNKNNGIALAQTAPGNFTFLWSNGSTTNKINGLTPGLYTVTVFSDIAACTETAVVEIKKISTPELTLIDLDHIKCFGELTGSLTVQSQTGVMPFKYLWNTGDTTALIEGIGAGIYSVIITDKNNCRDTLSQLEVTQPALLSTTGIVHAQTNLTTPNGSILAEPSGGTPPYSFVWSNGAGSQQIDSLSAGIYSVTITDSLNCVATNQFEILLSVGLQQVITLPLRAYPNPTNAWLYVQMPDAIQCSQDLQIKIIDQTGKTRIATHLQGLHEQISISVADLAAGAYRVILDCNNPLVSYETQVLIVR